MTVAELEGILSTIKDKKLEIRHGSYIDTELNGYYISQNSGKEYLCLTSLNVQPRVQK